MSLTMQIRPDQVEGMIKARSDATRKALVRASNRAALRSQALMVRRTPVDQGQLKNSWRVVLGSLAVTTAVQELAALVNDAPHAGIVELGARPHKVSAEGWAAIYLWVYRHRHLFGFVTKSGRTARARATRGNVRARIDVNPELERITWGIVKRIEKEGQKPTFFVRDSLPVLNEILGEEVNKQIERVAKQRIAPGKGGGT